MTLPPTAFTALVGCRLPMQQAGMGAVSTAELAAAVAGEGALGMIGATGLGPAEILHQVQAATDVAGTDARIGVNFLVPFLDLAAFEAAASCTAVIECFYADPDPELVARAHTSGTLVAWQVGSYDEAIAAAAAGCDLIVVQGIEAGGHVRGREPLFPLFDRVRPSVEVPIVAAGGIGCGRAVAAALLAGADAVRIGTRLLASSEANVHPRYADLLVRATAEDTVVTEAFSMGWPNAPHRALRIAVEAVDDAPETRSPLPPTHGFTGNVDAAALYAGTSVTEVKTVAPAASVIGELVADASLALARADGPESP